MNNGFTLLELSIVLVIIGLIIGGITAGKDLIKSAELNTVVADSQKYRVAVNSFKLKYNTLPGDMNNATAYWGTVTGSCDTVAGTGTQTCDGDGDGRVNTMNHTPSGSHEAWRFWEHLNNSEIISGDFTGIAPTATTVSSPESKIANAYWHFYYITNGSDWGKTQSARHAFSLSADSFLATAAVGDGVLTPPDLYSIDVKADDGSANSGKITDPNSGGGLETGSSAIGVVNAAICSNSSTSDGTYRLSSNELECTPIFDF